MADEVNPMLPQPKNSWTIPLLSILSIFALAFSGYLFWQNQRLMKQLAAVQTPTAPPTTFAASSTPVAELPDPTAGWKTYENQLYKFSFKYPAEYSLNDALQTSQDPAAWTTHKNLTLTNSVNNCNFSFMVNPDGFGPFFPNKFLTLSLTPQKILAISDERINSENLTPGKYSLVANGNISHQSVTGLLIFADCPENNQTYLNTLLTQILSTFKFTE